MSASIGKGFLDAWANQEEEAQVALLSAPVTFPPAPSVALSIFKSALEQASISSKVIYAMFPMFHVLDREALLKLTIFLRIQENAEYLFAHLTDVPASVPADRFIRTLAPPNLQGEFVEMLEEPLLQAMGAAEEVVEATARRIVHMGARVVAASSVHRQQVASLAILRRVKELDPQVRTVLGGHNVTGEMGLTVLRNFPSVDYVSFGEGDETIVEVCSNLLEGGGRPMPYGVVGRDEPYPERAPFRMTKDMDGVACPDYRDFFDEVQMDRDGFYGDDPAGPARAHGQRVFLEGSRGCAWAVKHVCTFCSMNGLNNSYREKTPEKLHGEILRMAKEYPGYEIALCDNMVSSRMMRKLFPLLAEDGDMPCSLFAEIRTNHGPEEVRALAEARFRRVQSGVESLNDHLLSLMGKGSTGVQNIALLKYCATFHVAVIWQMMAKIPGEKREDYEQMMGVMALLSHLHPPANVIYIDFMRFSRYCDRPQDYGLELRPAPLYRCCFADRPDITDNMGVYYEVVGGPFADTLRENRDIYRQLDKAVKRWNEQFHSDKPAKLLMTEADAGISIHDTRACAEEESCLLTGIGAEVYRLAWKPASLASLLEQLPGSSEDEVKAVLDDLVARKLMLFLSGKYLALAVSDK